MRGGAGRGHYRPAVSLRVVTWNLKGSARPDIGAVAAHLRDVGADVVAVQEIQRSQARRLAGRLDARSVRWSFKHFPVRTWPEGMAIVGVTVPVTVRAHALSARWLPWSWRRRIFQAAAVPARSEDGPATLVNVHFSTGEAAARRAVELAEVVAVIDAAGLPGIMVGDTNDDPDSALFRQMAAAGLRDTWLVAHPGSVEPDGATNWRGWRRGTKKPPTRRIDVVAAGDGVSVGEVTVPRFGEAGFEVFPSLSDHLPLSATLGIRPPQGA